MNFFFNPLPFSIFSIFLDKCTNRNHLRIFFRYHLQDLRHFFPLHHSHLLHLFLLFLLLHHFLRLQDHDHRLRHIL